MKGSPIVPCAALALALGFFGCASPLGSRLQTGHGDWTFEADRVAVYSWSYGLPGLMIFGNVRDGGELEATMKNGPYGPSGFQGLVIGLTKQMTEDDGYHGSAAFFVRYNRGTVELLNAIPYHKTSINPRLLASAPAEVSDGSSYTLRMSVVNGRQVAVWLDGRKVFEYTAAIPLVGKLALLAANGSYTFRGVKFAQPGPTDLQVPMLATAFVPPQFSGAEARTNNTTIAALAEPRIYPDVSGTQSVDPKGSSPTSDQIPVALHQTRPRYPSGARRRGITDEVVVDFVVDANGDVQNAYALRSTRHELDAAAVAAVSNWKFKPGRKGGLPVPTHMQVPIVATLDDE